RLRLLSEAPPRLLWLRGDLLRAARERLADGDTGLLPALALLRAQADSALTAGPFAVTVKRLLPPSRDPHDYASWGPYWWPDSTRPGGTPYVRRDGEVNPVLRRESDAPRLYALTDAVESLALAWYFTRDPRHPRLAALLLRSWFLDPASRMNRHLRYGQAIPGITEGRGTGIIDTRDLGRIADALTLLDGAPGWTAPDTAGLHTWFAEFLAWLTHSTHGAEEQEALNNHADWYDAQVAAIALFVADTPVARAALARLPERIAAQIDSAGRLPRELERTRSLHYSAFALEAFARSADLARHLGIDLWHWRAPGGGSIARALDFLAPYADPARPWPLEQVLTPPPDLLVPLLFRADAALSGRNYCDVLSSLPPALTRAHRARLLFAAGSACPREPRALALLRLRNVQD
ncbi:MAG: alginate lyase family protein, partial [Gemmatimonadetes bacterium]|nr:alginate lyase family protein [Gemmatimonadota bacterium]